MSYASKQSGLFNSNEIGNDILTNVGNTFPVIGNPLVSGTEYIIASIPVPKGGYAVQVAFDIEGDNTTAFEKIIVRVFTGSYAISDNDILINTTLPNSGTISSTYNCFVCIKVDQPAPLSATITPIYSGSQPTSPSYYVWLNKIA